MRSGSGPRGRRGWRSDRGAEPPDRGAGTVLAVGLIGAVVALVAVALPLYMALAGRSAATGAADAAALAAADARSGAVGGSPCALAERVAAANRADLEGCHVDGLVVTVGASIRVGIFHITAHATAGPPGGQGR